MQAHPGLALTGQVYNLSVWVQVTPCILWCFLTGHGCSWSQLCVHKAHKILIHTGRCLFNLSKVLVGIHSFLGGSTFALSAHGKVDQVPYCIWYHIYQSIWCRNSLVYRCMRSFGIMTHIPLVKEMRLWNPACLHGLLARQPWQQEAVLLSSSHVSQPCHYLRNCYGFWETVWAHIIMLQ